ncbi:lactoylglutathione lyase [Streptococcus hyovaginalis]|uniref:lactoylglutathione lyase n=1 Tax=Streptococcus hyovaginalis TaxID=149015 RepID=UPI002A7F1702|nr:VOC family protein [Streptococcus hyovaginalis]MDY4510490.1 VOC family protein [Streptococcus hyovaginalis]
MKMLHTCIRVQDLEASIAFYTKAFPLEEVRRKDFPDHQFTLVFLKTPNDDFEIELTYNYGHGAYDIGDGYGHLAVGVDDLEEAHEAHVEAGFEVTELKGLPGQEPHYYFVKDPDGYKVEVIRLSK